MCSFECWLSISASLARYPITYATVAPIVSPTIPARITPIRVRCPWYTLKPANSIVGSVPGSPITPDVAHISATPAYPRRPITCVARFTTGPVSEARRTAKWPSVPSAGLTPSARLVFPHARGRRAVRHRDTAATAARGDPGARRGRAERRRVHPRAGGEGLRGGAGRLSRCPSRGGRRERHRRDHDRAARARHKGRRRGGGAVVHLLRDRGGGRELRRQARVL